MRRTRLTVLWCLVLGGACATAAGGRAPDGSTHDIDGLASSSSTGASAEALTGRATTFGNMGNADCTPFAIARAERMALVSDAILRSTAFQGCVVDRATRLHVPVPDEHHHALSAATQANELLARLQSGFNMRYYCGAHPNGALIPQHSSAEPGFERSWGAEISRYFDVGSSGLQQYWDGETALWGPYSQIPDAQLHEFSHSLGYVHPSAEFRCHNTSCGGTASACSTFTDGVRCTRQQGCSWNGSTCATSACNALNGVLCWDQPGCSWNGSSCTGTPTGPRTCASYSHSLGDGSTCATQAGCTFESPTPGCIGVPIPCSSLGSQVECLGQTGCTFSGGVCSGTASTCSGFAEGTCETHAGCHFNVVGCAGGGTCTTRVTQSTCDATSGCHWIGESRRFVCTGSATSCTGLGATACASQSGCSFVGGVCTGTATSCGSFGNDGIETGHPGALCANQAGCLWQSTCAAPSYHAAQACDWTFGCHGTGVPGVLSTGVPTDVPEWPFGTGATIGSLERASALAGLGEDLYVGGDGLDGSFPYILSQCVQELVQQSTTSTAAGCSAGLFASSCAPDGINVLSSWSTTTRSYAGTCGCAQSTRHVAHFRAPDGVHFLAAANAGGGAFDATSSAAGAWETFYIRDINGGQLMSDDTVEIRTWSSNEACTTITSQTTCNSTPGCRFFAFASGGGGCGNANFRVRAQSAANSHPDATCASEASEDPTVCGTLSQWRIRHSDLSSGPILDGQSVAILNVGRGLHLTAGNMGGTTLTTDQPGIGAWEIFTYQEPREALLVNVRAPNLSYVGFDGVTSTLAVTPLEADYDGSGNVRAQARQQTFWVVDHNGGALNYGDTVSFEQSVTATNWSTCTNGTGALVGTSNFTSAACQRFTIRACHGYPTACGNLTASGQTACNAQTGCFWNTSTLVCGDSPGATACHTITSQSACTTHGCAWAGPVQHHDTVRFVSLGTGAFLRQSGSQILADGTTSTASAFAFDFAQARSSCVGPAGSTCTTFLDSTSCWSHSGSGCSWGNACVGPAVPCSALSGATACNAQMGCSMSGTTCTGTSYACSQLNQSTCGLVGGCEWGQSPRF